MWVCAAVAGPAAAGALAEPAAPDGPADGVDASLDLDRPDGPEGSDGWGPLVRFNLIWENDGSLPGAFSASDEQYTNGLKLDLAWRPAWAQRLAERAPLSGRMEDVQGAFGLSVFQLMFTPDDLRAEEVIEDDRPYAGWLGVAAYWQRAGRVGEGVAALDHVELDLGIIGEASGAEALQTFVHSAYPDQIKPAGWDNQLGHEPAVNLTLRRKYRFSTAPTDSGLGLHVIPSVGGTAGTVYRRVEADVTVRLGWRLPDDFGPSRIADVNAATGGWTHDWGFYIFLRGGATLSEHNVFLDGTDFRDSHSVTKEPLVGEAQIGAALQLFRGLEIGYSHTFLSREFEGQNGTHSYGTFSIGYRAVF